MNLRRRAALAHAARAAALSTVVIAVLYVAVAGVVDLVVTRRMTAQLDGRLASVLTELRDGGPLSDEAPLPLVTKGRDVDDAPMLFWNVSRSGVATALSAGAPGLPKRRWQPGVPVSEPIGTSGFRLLARRAAGGWLVAGESLASVKHVQGALLAGEAAVAPVILLAVYLGALGIGLKAAGPLERARRRQLEFTADASHELRTPLSVIEAEVGLALGTERDASYYRESLARVGAESGRLRKIVDDLLWLARSDSAPPPPGNEPVDLAPLAAACVDRFANLADARDIELSLSEEGGASPLVDAPPEWIDRLLGVLVDNACRYAPSGGQVDVAVGVSGSRSYLAVSDDGPGIPEADRDRLFDRFHRATEEPGGVGLGLAIADSVVRATRGRWKIGAAAGGGARMEVSWHRAGSGAGATEPVAEPVGRKVGRRVWHERSTGGCADDQTGEEDEAPQAGTGWVATPGRHGATVDGPDSPA